MPVVIGDGVCTGLNATIVAGLKIGIARTKKAGRYVAAGIL